MEDKRQALIADINKYDSWGKQLAGQCFIYMANSNAPLSELTIHNGLEYFKAKMKLNVLTDDSHTDEEKEERLKQIDIDIYETEKIMKNDLKYRGLLLP